MMYIALQLFTYLVGSFIFYWIVKWIQYRQQLKAFTGPVSFPLIGSCYNKGFLSFYKHMFQLRMRYGQIFTFFSFHKPLLVICHPKIVKRILSDSKTFYKGDDYTVYFARAFGKGLVTSNGEDHRKGRSIFGKYFIRSSVSKMTEKFNQITIHAISTILTPIVNDTTKSSTVINIEEFFAVLALRNFMYFCCHTDISTNPKLESRLCHTVAKASYAMVRVLLLKEPDLPNLFPNSHQVKMFNDLMDETFNLCVDERQRRDQAEEPIDDALTVLINDDSLTAQDRIDHFKTMISAGHDTTAFFMSYMAYLLARNPHIQQKLYDYLDEKLEGGIQRPNLSISADVFAELKYLHFVMMETLRMYAIIPVVTRECAEDVHIKEADVEVTIPKNITVLMPMIVMNKDPELWENPNEFNPSRFEHKQSADFTSAKDGFFPFAYGSRTCIGNVLAQIESAIAFIHILRQFVIEEDKGFRPNILAGISLTTSNGINIRLRKRDLFGK